MLDEAVFTHVTTLGNNKAVYSTSMFSSVSSRISKTFEWYSYTSIVIIFLNRSQKLTFCRISTPKYHVINAITSDAECQKVYFVGQKTSVMTIMLWDLMNVMRFVFSETEASSAVCHPEIAISVVFYDPFTHARISQSLWYAQCRESQYP